MANETKVYWGTATTVISLAATLASGANTYSGLGSLTMNELDNSTYNYPYALAVLDIPDTFAAAPAANAAALLYINRNDIDGTNDHLPVPITGDLKNAEIIGTFDINASDEAHRVAIIINIEGIKKANFFIKNNTGQNISYTSNPTTVKITPYSLGPT